MSACEQDEALFLDVIDLTLKFDPFHKSVDDLRNYLELGGSEWTIDDEGKNLIRRVDEGKLRLKEEAISISDDASIHLENAWKLAYGRTANASNAWTHSIKALEATLSPIISPDNQRATLGTILQNIEQKPDKWRVHLVEKELEGVHAIVQMLHIVWPNPDRHASGKTREPTLEEAEIVLLLTTTVMAIARRHFSRS